MMPSSPNVLLLEYPAFFYARRSRGKTSRLPLINNLVAIGFGLILFLSALLDSSLELRGRAVGFFEHPAIFFFIATQCICLYAVLRGARTFLDLPKWGSHVLKPDFLARRLEYHQGWLREAIKRKNPHGSFTYNILVSIGIAAFAWNSIANQDPIRFAGFDFWDSMNHPYGYAATRVYKFYMWTFFFPALIHLELMMLICFRRLVVDAADSRGLVLEPFHPDGCGGVRKFMDTVLIPLIPPLAVSSLLAVSAVSIHRKVDFTTVGALGLVCVTFLVLYLTLATALRRAIIIEKDRQLKAISDIQNAQFFELIGVMTEAAKSEEVGKTIASLADLSKYVRGLPNWPQLHFVVKAVSLAGSSPITAWLAGLLAPKIGKLIDF